MNPSCCCWTNQPVAVDPQSRREFWDSLFELADAGTTILVSTHYMDEAERCHRLAILDQGRLVADGAPRELCAALPYVVWLVDCAAHPRRAQRALQQQAGIVALAQIGAELRVLAASTAWDSASLAQHLRAADVDAQVRRGEPNLEDVFVAATRKPARVAAGTATTGAAA